MQGQGMPPESPPLSLLARIARKDPDAMKECLDRYGSLIWTIAQRLLGNRADAEDAVQETFLDVWRSADRYRPELGSEVAFLTMIARRRILDRRRRLESSRTEQALLEEPARVGTDSLAICEEAEKARKVLDSFPEEPRRVLHLAICQGLSHQRVAEITGLPLGTVKSHIRRGILRVKEILEAPMGQDGHR